MFSPETFSSIDLYFELVHGVYLQIKTRYIGTQGLYNFVLFILFIYYRSLCNYIGRIQNYSECNYPIPEFHRNVSSLAFQVIANHIPFSLDSIFKVQKVFVITLVILASD